MVVGYIFLKVFKSLFLPKLKGNYGESKVAFTLSRLKKKDYWVYNDIYLLNNGRTTQIDHLVLSVYGIFVIETKNYKGWIFGNEKSTYWTQVLFKEKHSFYNPVLQNWGHINFLKRLSKELQFAEYHPIIVFAGSAELKRIESTVPVIYQEFLNGVIKSQKEVVFNHKQLEKIDGVIRLNISAKKQLKNQHRNSFKSKKHKSNRTCPKCGGYLKNRKGKYGDFLGCSSYPNCDYTKKL